MVCIIKIIMKKIFVLIGIVAVSLMFTGCATVGMIGAVYTGVTNPVDVTSNAVGDKVGTASSVSVLGLVAVGDGGVNKAAKLAGITKISHVDVKTTSVLGLFTSQKYFVYGE